MARKLKLDLGSGPTPAKGFRGVDLYTGPERVDLMRFPWPWATDSVDEVWCSHFIEHMPSAHPVPVWSRDMTEPADGLYKSVHFLQPEMEMRYPWVQFVDELWRILKPGAKATVIHPNLKSSRAFQDPTHCDFIPVERWMYVQQGWRQANELDHPPYPTCDFDVEVGASFAPEFAGRTDEATAQAAAYQWDVALDLRVILTKRG
jgi:hypothetical protein